MQWFRLLPFGTYKNNHSLLHDADPRSKIIFIATYLSFVAYSNDLLDMLYYGIVALLLILISRLPFAYLWNGLKGMIPLLLALAFCQLLLGDLTNAALIPSKLILFILMAILFSLTTTPAMLAEGLGAMLSPLRFVRFPVQHFVLMITVAFRFIPLFLDEAESIMTSQKLRNARYGGSFATTVRSLPQLLVALFVTALRRAEQLALAMDARCFILDNRIRVSRLRFGWRDWVIISYALVLLLLRLWLIDTQIER